MNQANDGGTDGMMAEGMVINGQIDTFWRQRQQDLLTDQMLGVTNRKVKNGTKISGPNS